MEEKSIRPASYEMKALNLSNGPRASVFMNWKHDELDVSQWGIKIRTFLKLHIVYGFRLSGFYLSHKNDMSN